MPNPETIKNKLMQLPILSEWEKPSGRMSDRKDKVWEGNEKGGHFHFYGHRGYLCDPVNRGIISAVGYTLSITGSDKSKGEILADFSAVLGPPRRNVRHELQQSLSGKKSKIAYFTWLQPEDEAVENNPSLVVIARWAVEAMLLNPLIGDTNTPGQLRDRHHILPRR